MGLVLDTSAYAALNNGHPAVKQAILAADQIYVPAVTAGELLFGFIKGRRTSENSRRFNKFLTIDRVSQVAITQETAQFYASTKRGQQLLGFSLDDNALWIAAVCLQLRQPLLALDSDFARIPGLELAAL